MAVFTLAVDEATFIKMRAVLLNMAGEGFVNAKIARLIDALHNALQKG